MDNIGINPLEDVFLSMKQAIVVQKEVKDNLEKLREQVRVLVREITLYRVLGTPEDLGIYSFFLLKILQELKEGDDDEVLTWLNKKLTEAKTEVRLHLPELYPPPEDELPEGCPGWGTYNQKVLVCALCYFNIECMTLQERKNGGSGGFAMKDLTWMKTLGDKLEQNDRETYMSEVLFLTEKEASGLFERESQKRLGMSSREFISAWESGGFDDDPDQPDIMYVAMLLPLVNSEEVANAH